MSSKREGVDSISMVCIASVQSCTVFGVLRRLGVLVY